MFPFHVLIGGWGVGLLEGSEIGMIVLAAASKYKWKKAWRTAFAGLATIIPILLALYLFFTVLPLNVVYLASGAIIFALGAYFFYEGLEHKVGKEREEESIGIGLLGVYTAILIEECEASSIVMSIGAVTHAYMAALIGMAVGLAIPLAGLRSLKGVFDRIPGWALQLAVGLIMMSVAIAIILLRF
ncbi:MAG: hypothetical protein KGH94_03045 [Candidatus Micrarchaeota archaeon]|nr:hypothetical protein [Candidatus Micrarchaeota archaeon]